MNYDEPLNRNIRAWVAPHNGTDGWDNWALTDPNLRAYLFYGDGLRTEGTIRLTIHDSGISTVESDWYEEGGDGTVPAFSAKAGDLPEFDGKRYPFKTETLKYTLPPR